MTLADASAAYAQQLNIARSLPADCPDDELTKVWQDVAKALAAVEVAWLEHCAA